MKYHTLFLSKNRKDVAKIDVCCSRDWRFKGLYVTLFSKQMRTLVRVMHAHSMLLFYNTLYKEMLQLIITLSLKIIVIINIRHKMLANLCTCK